MDVAVTHAPIRYLAGMRNIRHLPVLFLMLLCGTLRSQNPIIQSIIDAVSVDSLMLDLEKLSGEIPIDIGNGPEVIFSRNESQPGNALAADWLQARCEQMGQTPTTDLFDDTNGENIIVELIGAVHPERKVIICGHYDAMPGGPVAAPAADDDGSGTVAVLEALRVLSEHAFENSIIFAMWDEEELGKLGSIHYANGIDTGEVQILGVVNMDAISYDGDGDGLMRIHTKNIANSIALKDTALAVNQTYAGLQLNVAVNLPGAVYSDHASFWNKGLSAILIIEDFDDDGNPHYHTTTDLVEYIDQPYFQGLARLSIGTAATLARPIPDGTAVEPTMASEERDLFVYPNPTPGRTVVRMALHGMNASLALYDAFGRRVMDLANVKGGGGERTQELDLSSLAPGSYVLRLTNGDRAASVPVVRLH